MKLEPHSSTPAGADHYGAEEPGCVLARGRDHDSIVATELVSNGALFLGWLGSVVAGG